MWFFFVFFNWHKLTTKRVQDTYVQSTSYNNYVWSFRKMGLFRTNTIGTKRCQGRGMGGGGGWVFWTPEVVLNNKVLIDISKTYQIIFVDFYILGYCKLSWRAIIFKRNLINECIVSWTGDSYLHYHWNFIIPAPLNNFFFFFIIETVEPGLEGTLKVCFMCTQEIIKIFGPVHLSRQILY